jgi:hypothetical protein
MLIIFRTKREAEKGTCLLTTHRIVWYKAFSGLEIQLYYINNVKKAVFDLFLMIFYSFIGSFFRDIQEIRVIFLQSRDLFPLNPRLLH